MNNVANRDKKYKSELLSLMVGKSVSEYANDGTQEGHAKHSALMDGINHIKDHADPKMIEAIEKVLLSLPISWPIA